MRRLLRFIGSRPRAALLAGAGCASLGAAFASLAACLTAPPPDLPELPLHRPTILHDAVVPPTDYVLTQLPTEFVVPVVLEDPNEYFSWSVFVDYPEVPAQAFFGVETPTPGTIDGGVFLQTFDDPPVDDPAACNRIEFIVAHQFNQSSPHTPDSLGGDIVTWLYSTGGPAACVETYDAGDGAFVSADVVADTLPISPQDGGDR
jgi:hypothetical protein